MEVSGMPVFLGGVGKASGRLCGRYVGAVYSSRFEACGLVPLVDSHLEAMGHDLEADAVANALKKTEDAESDERLRCADMLESQ
jgi:hypothetical protein